MTFTPPAAPEAIPTLGGSLSRLAESGNLLSAPPLHGRSLDAEEFDGKAWRPSGTLALFPNTAFLNDEKLYNVAFHPDTNSVLFSSGNDETPRAGRLYFTQDFGAFIGTVSAADGQARAVRGTAYNLVYHTSRRRRGDASAQQETWVDLRIENRWEGDDESPVLHAHYFLGDREVSTRTAVTGVNRMTWETTLEMVSDPSDPFGEQDQFQVVIAFDGAAFSGSYTDKEGTVYDWQGNANPAALARNTADAVRFSAYDAPSLSLMQPAAQRTTARRLADTSGPTLSVQDLNSITSLDSIPNKDGSNSTMDRAQIKTGEFFNYSLVNGVGKPWLTDLFGHPYDVPDPVKQIVEANRAFFQDNSVLAVGQMLYDSLKADSAHKDVIARIQPDKLDAGWKALAESPAYASLSQQLYLEGYRTAVPGLRPYLDNDPKGWALRYYKFLTSPEAMGIWQTQVASNAFANVKEQMYEWYIKLSVLDPDPHTFSETGEVDPAQGDRSDQQTRATLGQQMLSTAYAALLGVSYARARWTEDMSPILAQVIQNAADGDPDTLGNIPDELVKQSLVKYREALREMISIFDTAEELGTEIANLMTLWSKSNPNRSMREAGDDIYDGLARLFEEGPSLQRSPLQQRWDVLKFRMGTGWDAFKGAVKKVLPPLLYAAGAAYIIYSLVEDIQDSELTAHSVVHEVGLGLFALALVLKGTHALMTRVANWLRVRAFSKAGFMWGAARGMIQWFSKNGVRPEGKLGTILTRIFGKNYAEFFSKRLAPATAVFGIVMSAVWLADAYTRGDTREIVFGWVNTFFSLAEAAFIGLQLMSFGWAGPVGVAVAVVGLMVALVQLIWNLVDPPVPPPDAIVQFVTGPMKDRGYAV